MNNVYLKSVERKLSTKKISVEKYKFGFKRDDLEEKETFPRVNYEALKNRY